jgi:transcriptional regulator with XRE-family HTH domain
MTVPARTPRAPKMKPKGPARKVPPAAQKLRAARLALGMTATEAARRAGVAHTTWANAEAGRDTLSLDRTHHFATSIGVDPHEVDPRLAPANDTSGRAETLTLRYGAGWTLVGLTPADDKRLRGLIRVPVAAWDSLPALFTAAAANHVRLDVRFDLDPPKKTGR